MGIEHESRVSGFGVMEYMEEFGSGNAECGKKEIGMRMSVKKNSD